MKGKVITKTLVVSDKTKEMMVDYFEDLKRIRFPVSSPIRFQVKVNGS